MLIMWAYIQGLSTNMHEIQKIVFTKVTAQRLTGSNTYWNVTLEDLKSNVLPVSPGSSTGSERNFYFAAKYFTLVFDTAVVGYCKGNLFWHVKKNNLTLHSKLVFLLTSVDFGSRSESSKMNVNQVRACVADFQTVEYRLRSMTYKKLW